MNTENSTNENDPIQNGDTENIENSSTISELSTQESSLATAPNQADADADADFVIIEEETDLAVREEDDNRRRWLLLLLLMLLLCAICCVAGLFYRYLTDPEPLPDMLPLPVDVNYAPHYLFSIYGVDKPVGVALSPEADRVYICETGEERLIKMFNRDGGFLDSFHPPRTNAPTRSPVYVDTDSQGRVFVADRTQHAIYVYNETGGYLDTILGPDLTLSEYVAKHVGGLQENDTFSYELFEDVVFYQRADEGEKTFPAPDPIKWSPLGIRIDGTDRLLISDVASEGFNVIRQFPTEVIQAESWHEFNPPEIIFGEYGQGNGQFIFPNSAVVDSQGRIYVTDGNNGRVSVWNDAGEFQFNFGQGSGDGSLSLPRGAAIDDRDRLHVVDAVGQNVKVYDVSQAEPEFLYQFGDWGADDGQFDYPGDIVLDATGRLYIADRENNRVQVWSY